MAAQPTVAQGWGSGRAVCLAQVRREQYVAKRHGRQKKV